jgi:hypothetical protein
VPRKLIPDHKVRQMLRAGKTHKEIVEALAREDHIYVTPQAISAWMRRNGVETNTRARTGYPGRIAPEHRQMLPTRAIQWYNRREAGEKIPEGAERRLERVLAKLKEHDAVFHYDPDTLEGWWPVPRREGDHPLYRRVDGL